MGRLDRRLLFVCGKGGVGKTVVTAALALAGFRRRRRVLVVELSPWGRIRELLGGPEPGPEPREVQPRLELVRIDPRRALEDFLESLLRFRMLSQRLLSSQSFSILTAAAPGIEEFLVLSKIAGLASERTGLRREYRWDLVVVDCPASGHSVPFLSTARTLREMMPVGPIRRMADEVHAVLSDWQRTAAVPVTIPEEMAVNETLELVGGLRKERAVPLGPVVANAVWPERFDPESRAHLLSLPASSHPLVAAAHYHLRRRRRTEEQLRRLEGESPILLPFLLGPAVERPSLGPLEAALGEHFADAG